MPVGSGVWCVACQRYQEVTDSLPGPGKTLVVLACCHAWDLVEKGV